MGEEDHRAREIIRTTHILIILLCAAFAAVLIALNLFMEWEGWTIPILVAGVLITFFIHIMETGSVKTREYFFSGFLLFEIFYYGVHANFYEVVSTVGLVLIVFTLIGNLRMVYLTSAMGIFILVFHIISTGMGNSLNSAETKGLILDSEHIVRVIWQFVLILLFTVVARAVIVIRKRKTDFFEENITELKEENDRAGNFLANVSHEIRTPINAVIGLSAVSLGKEKNPEVKKDLTSIRDAGYRVAEQISDILDYTEIDMGKLSVNVEAYMITSVVNDLVVQLQMITKNTVELIVDVDANVPSVLIGDQNKIKKILWHLIANGIKFSREGGVYVHIYTVDREYGVNLCMEVTDTGVGMADDEIDKIFDKFYQSDSSRTRAAGGLGLGLSIVQGFTQAMDGFLSVDSAENLGTTVRVSIPQKVDTRIGCMTLPNREDYCIGTYLRFGDISNPQVREFYNETLHHLSAGLNVPLHKVETMADLNKIMNAYRLTHVFVGPGEYRENGPELEKLSEEVSLVVIADDDFKLPENSRINVLRKPLYCFAIMNALNQKVEGLETQELGHFYTPGLKALVVDDEPMNLLVADGIFREYGMIVSKAMSGPEAIVMCENNDYDIIFMDHMMPDMDGIECMKRLRTNAEREGKELTIVALTANAVSSAKDMFLTEGFDGFIPKPIEITEFERVLRRVLPKSVFSYEKPVETRIKTDVEDDSADMTMISFEASNIDGESPLFVLEEAGVDTKSGLKYCQNDMEFYISLLKEYESNSAKKKAELELYYKDEVWDQYAIRVHGLKSTSKMIGASELSELAKTMEDASKAGNGDLIKAHHDRMMLMYEDVTDAIRSAYPGGTGENTDETDSAPSDTENTDDDDEILEFLPEEE